MTEKIEENRRTATTEVNLTTAFGVGIVDSGCWKSVMGRRLDCYLQALPVDQGTVKYQDDKHLFRFGNGTIETSKQPVELPVGIGGRRVSPCFSSRRGGGGGTTVGFETGPTFSWCVGLRKQCSSV